jgi:putative sigma-54 modulation protein
LLTAYPPYWIVFVCLSSRIRHLSHSLCTPLSIISLDLNADAESYIHKKFDRLKRHLNQMSDAKVEISRTSTRSQGERVNAQMTLSVGGYTLRGQDVGDNVFAAVDSVTDIVDRQIRRFKGKVYRSEKGQKSLKSLQPESDISVDLAGEDALEELGQLVRTKRFTMSPMSVEDAILQMEMLDHSFFLFFNMDSSEYNVAYRRHDGDYGLIEPQLD